MYRGVPDYHTYLLLLLLIVVCVAGSAQVNDSEASCYELELVQVVHRHGARSPLVQYNQTLICGLEYPCGYLNQAGQTMMLEVGRFLRHRYTADASVVRAPFLPQDGYNLTVSYSRSSDVLRTLQSSVAFLRGLFPRLPAYYPAVHTIDRDADLMLYSEAIPALRARRRYATDTRLATCTAELDAQMPFATLRAVAAEADSAGRCHAHHKRLGCADVLCDLADSYRASGRLHHYPMLRRHHAAVCAATACLTRETLVYNASRGLHQRQGSFAQTLLAELVANMRQRQTDATDGAAASLFKLYEYSTHDSMLVPLASTIGPMSSYETVMPVYGTTVIFELLRERDGTAWHVRVLRGQPGQTPETNYTFRLLPFALRCTDAQGEDYVAPNQTCPLDDFVRLVAKAMPRDVAGLCYLDAPTRAAMNCSNGDVATAPRELSDDCLAYRKQCPAFACPPQHRLCAVDYRCYRDDAAAAGATMNGVRDAERWVLRVRADLVMLGLLVVAAAIGLCAQPSRVRFCLHNAPTARFASRKAPYVARTRAV